MAETPNTLCRTCGIRRDVDGLCQCVDVLYARIRELEARPRPVAEWGDGMWHGEIIDMTMRAHQRELELVTGHIVLGKVVPWGDSGERWWAVCRLTDERMPADPCDLPSARAWLTSRVRAAGFEIRGDQ